MPPRTRDPRAGIRKALGHGCIPAIDDEDVIRRTAKTALARFGDTVLVADDGRQGIAAFRKAADAMDLVLWI